MLCHCFSIPYLFYRFFLIRQCFFFNNLQKSALLRKQSKILTAYKALRPEHGLGLLQIFAVENHRLTMFPAKGGIHIIDVHIALGARQKQRIQALHILHSHFDHIIIFYEQSLRSKHALSLRRLIDNQSENPKLRGINGTKCLCLDPVLPQQLRHLPEAARPVLYKYGKLSDHIYYPVLSDYLFYRNPLRYLHPVICPNFEHATEPVLNLKR